MSDALAAIGPFAIDMYIPTLPSMAEHLQTSTAAAQMTLMAFFLGFGVTSRWLPAVSIACPS